MARESAAQRALNVVAIRHPRLAVPDGTPAALRDAFLAIVGASPAAAFRADDAPLVLRLAHCRVMLRDPETGLDDFLRVAKLELALCRALRLCPSARTRPETAARQKGKRSIYELMDDDA